MLKNKRIVIVGGTSGIGLATSQFFIENGAKIVAFGKKDSFLTLASELLGQNGNVIAGDATQPNEVNKAILYCEKKFGGFDGLFHVAGGSGRQFGDGPLHELTLEGWNKTLELNLTSIMLSNQAAINYFLKNKKQGSILNLGSVLGSFPSKTYFSTHAYAAAKSAVIGFTKSIAAYYAEYNIRCNVLAPALVVSPMSERALNNERIMNFVKTKQPIDNGRVGKPNDLVGAAAYFLSDLSCFTTGQVLTIDGGWSISDGQI